MAEGPDEQTARAKGLIAERKYDEAIRVCRRVLLTRPDVVQVRLLLGQALLATARYEQVRVEMMALARKHPNLAELHRIVGEAYLRAGHGTKAVDSLRRAVELDPRDEVARDLLAEAGDEDIAPVSQTIERWFGDDEPKTVEQELPPHFEEQTPVPRRLPSASDPPSVEIDPGIAVEAAAMRRSAAAPKPIAAPPLRPAAPPPPSGGSRSDARTSVAAGARPVPARKPTITGLPIPPPSAPPPPAARSKPTLTGAPLPPPSRAPSQSGSSRDAETNAGRGRGMASVPLSHPEFEDDDDTTLGRPASRTAEPPTDELDIREIGPNDVPPSDDDDEDEPTMLGRKDAIARELAAPARARSSVAGPAAPPPPAGSAGAPFAQGRPRSVPPAGPPRASPPRSGAPPPGPVQALPPLAAPSAPSFPGPPRAPAAQTPRARPPESDSDAHETMLRAPLQSSGAFDAAVTAPRPFLGGTSSPAVSTKPEPPTDPRREAPRAETTTEATRRPRPFLLTPRGLAIVGVVAIVVLTIGVVSVRSFLRGRADDAIRSAASIASADGRYASLERAIHAIDENGADEPWRIALRARMLATLTLEHAEDHATEVEATLAGLGREGAALPDARVARSLLLVARGRGADALGVLSGLAASGDELAEAFRARAWAAATSGRIAPAEESARQALAARPRTPRHAALEGVLRYQAGDAAGALQVLDSVPNGSTSPAIRVARARVLLESGGDPTRAAAEADAVLTELAPSATPVETGWAHLVRARIAATRGDLVVARSEAEEAALRTPGFDELYGLAVAETLLVAGSIDGARAALGRLPEAAVDPTRRASLAAEVALAGNDLAAAETALIAAGSGAHADLLRGRLREARGELEIARQLFERAAADPREALTARIRAGSVLVRLSRPREARVQLEQALRLAPADAEAVTLFVRATLATGDPAAADAALTAALAQRPGAIDLVAARGSVLLALGRIDEALASLEQACAARPQDAELRAELGEAALRGGRRAAAVTAFTEALRLAPGLARAHLGVARLALEDARWDEASGALDHATTGGAAPIDVARLRAELAVARGLGAGAADDVEALLSQHPRDATLYAALGHLRAQAEGDRDARDAFTRALRADDEHPEALLGRAGVETRRGDLGGAARSIDRADRSGRQRGASPSFTARVTVARARLRFEVSDFEDARRLAEQAITTDPKCGEAHLLLAILADEGDADPVPHLRSAIVGTYTPPEALGLLTPRLAGTEACEVGRRYTQAAPRGFDRDDVDRAIRRCD